MHKEDYVVKLNVGGKLFLIKKSTLLENSPNGFKNIFLEKFNESSIKIIEFEDDSIYIERDSESFKIIYKYLCGYTINYSLLDKQTITTLYEDAEYYGFDKLKEDLEEYVETPEYYSDVDILEVVNDINFEGKRFDFTSIDFQTFTNTFKIEPKKIILTNISKDLKEFINQIETNIINKYNKNESDHLQGNFVSVLSTKNNSTNLEFTILDVFNTFINDQGKIYESNLSTIKNNSRFRVSIVGTFYFIWVEEGKYGIRLGAECGIFYDRTCKSFNIIYPKNLNIE